LRLLGSVLAAACAAALAAGCAASSTGSERITARATAWTVSGVPLDIRIATHGSLAERRVSIVVVVNGNVLGSFPTERGAVVVSVPARRLRAGENSLLVKSGRERSSLRVRVVPVAVPAAILGLAALALVARWLSRRRRARPA